MVTFLELAHATHAMVLRAHALHATPMLTYLEFAHATHAMVLITCSRIACYADVNVP